MPKKTIINLIGILSPFCLMKIKQQLSGLERGEILLVLLQDKEVLSDLRKILECSADKIIDVKNEQTHFKVLIQKS